MKKITKIILWIIALVLLTNSVIKAEPPLPGYSEWSTEKTGDENEISELQYGRKLPIEWSSWSTEKPSSVYQRWRDGIKKHYAFKEETKPVTFYDAKAKRLYRWNFSSKRKIVYLYADVDTYISGSNDYYEGPPLQLYCDGNLIASTGVHNELKNWNPSINASCSYMELYMSDNSGHDRNRTMVVGTWVGSYVDEYSYVIKWNNGQDWRTDKEYEHITGSNPQIPTQRIVYSHPVTYKINYDLNGGTANGKLTYTYTVLDEVSFPTLSKIAHDFLGFYDSKGNKVEKITKGTYGDINLYAKFKERIPKLTVGYTYFDKDEENPTIDIKEVIKQSNAEAYDEKQGDITDKIVIKSIEYRDKEKTVEYPNYLEVDQKDQVTIKYTVTNDVGGTSEVTRIFYILGKGVEIENYSDNIKIYSRYISKNYIGTLDTNSIWNNDDYKKTLNSAFN